MKAVIVAAGMGSRFLTTYPKTLVSLGEDTLLACIMKNMARVGIREFVVVVGYQAQTIQAYLRQQEDFALQVSVAENPHWRQGNGLSVLAAEPYVGPEPFVLAMADHLVSPSALARVIQAPNQANLLLVDTQVRRVFDLEDATKVQVVRQKILQIGKDLPAYNGIDCGIFRLTSRFFDAMRAQGLPHNDSISAGIAGLIRNNDMEAVFLREDECWIDIDTPQAYRYAVEHLHRLR